MAWHKKPTSVVLLYIFAAILWYWETHIPSPGKGVAAMAVAAALMSLRGNMNGKEKLAWICLLFSFLLLELTSIDTERNIAESLRSTTQRQETANFDKIGKGIESAIDKGARQFSATMSAAAQNYDEVTGGSSYPVVIPIVAVDGFKRMVGLEAKLGRHSPQITILDAHIYVRRYPVPPRKSRGEAISLQKTTYVGPIDPSYPEKIPLLDTGSPPSFHQVMQMPITYQIDIHARNGSTIEILEVRPVKDASAALNFGEYRYVVRRNDRVIEEKKTWTVIDYP